MRINGMCDDVMVKLMEKLKIEIPEFTLKRYVKMSKISKDKIKVEGVDYDGTPYSLFKSVSLK